MKIILDTNVLISGIFLSGLPYQILNAWRYGKFKIVLSQEIIDEYPAVAERISLKYEGIDFERILELVIIKSEVGQTVQIDKNVCRDESDLKFISCAIVSRTKIIVSGDKQLLNLNGY
jgi:putative PIN family toxin of toxin-antitoxin system